MIELMKLPFAENALEPFVSAETVRCHYGKHHKGYVDKVNELAAETEFQDMSLEEIIARTFGKNEYQALYSNAGQVYNHNIYWNSAGIGERFDADMQRRIEDRFGTSDVLREKLADEAAKFFGSGWVWLAEGKGGKFDVITTRNGDVPLSFGFKPVLAVDVWEHAYYLDYRNRKKDYAMSFVRNVLKI